MLRGEPRTASLALLETNSYKALFSKNSCQRLASMPRAGFFEATEHEPREASTLLPEREPDVRPVTGAANPSLPGEVVEVTVLAGGDEADGDHGKWLALIVLARAAVKPGVAKVGLVVGPVFRRPKDLTGWALEPTRKPHKWDCMLGVMIVPLPHRRHAQTFYPVTSLQTTLLDPLGFIPLLDARDDTRNSLSSWPHSQIDNGSGTGRGYKLGTSHLSDKTRHSIEVLVFITVRHLFPLL